MLVYPPQQSLLIYRISYLSLISSLYAIYRGHYDLALVPGSVFITSINFWSNPTYDSWWRYPDMIVVATGLTYELYRASEAENGIVYYSATSVAVCAFAVSCFMHRINRIWAATYLHMMLHLFGNIGNIALYAGYITPSPHSVHQSS